MDVLLFKKRDPGVIWASFSIFDSPKNIPISFALAARKSQEKEVLIGNGASMVSLACFRIKLTNPAHQGQAQYEREILAERGKLPATTKLWPGNPDGPPPRKSYAP